MDQVIKSVASDINDSQSVVNLEYDQYEKGLHIIYCTILDASYSGSLSGVSAILAAKKPDGTYIYNSCTIDGKTIKVPITEQMTASPGPYIADLIINNSGVRETVQKFRLTIRAAAVPDTEITSSSEYTALKSIDSTVLDTVQSYIDTKYATEYTLAELQSAQADCNAAMQTFPTANTGTEGQYLRKKADGNAEWQDDGVIVGGRNLIISSKENWTDKSVLRYRGIIGGRKHCSEYGLLAGDPITFSVDIKTIEKTSIKASIAFFSDGTTTTISTINTSKSCVTKGSSGKVSVSCLIPADAEYIEVALYNLNPYTETTSSVEQYRHDKLEFGTKSTAWDPAPEDYPLLCNPVGTILPRSVNTNPGTDIGGTWVAVTGYPDGTYAFKRTA